jgi:hypothetical protein
MCSRILSNWVAYLDPISVLSYSESMNGPVPTHTPIGPVVNGAALSVAPSAYCQRGRLANAS